MKIYTINPSDYKELIEIWEASVRATHDFLKEEDVLFFKTLILEQYFDAVDLHCAKDEHGKILGFIGVADDNIEMLFISPDCRRQGVGRVLIDYAINCQGAIQVDVNEQNPQAIGFYKHIGFKVVGRSATDSQGKPFPLLHMTLNTI
ncbi:acetyltransferase [Desulfogranum japonicum]|uniref:acetyltransferase n=1 Tax=Desulfogranum japonicum TaxID=231447 RepID=UPI0004160C62|nr:acetyltransferase [Desulfogranum japonicum]